MPDGIMRVTQRESLAQASIQKSEATAHAEEVAVNYLRDWAYTLLENGNELTAIPWRQLLDEDEVRYLMNSFGYHQPEQLLERIKRVLRNVWQSEIQECDIECPYRPTLGIDRSAVYFETRMSVVH